MSWVWFGTNPPVVQFSAQPQLGVTGPVGGREGRIRKKREEIGRIFGTFQIEHVGENGSNKSPASAPPTLVLLLVLPACLPARQHLPLSSPPLRLPVPPPQLHVVARVVSVVFLFSVLLQAFFGLIQPSQDCFVCF